MYLFQVTSVTTTAGLSTNYSYDSKGNLLAAVSPTGDKTMLSYLSRGQVDQVKNKDGLLLVDNEYDRFGSLISTTSTDGRTTTFEYDINGRQTARITEEKAADGSPLQIREVKLYDVNDRVIGTQLYHVTKNAGGAWQTPVLQWSTSTVYDPLTGLVLSQTDQHNLKTEYLYDRRGNQIRVVREVEVRAYSDLSHDFAQPVKTKTAQWTVYDDQGRVVLSTDTVSVGATVPDTSPAVGANRTMYDVAGRVIGTKRQLGIKVKIEDLNHAPPNGTNYNSLKSLEDPSATIINVSSTQTIYDQAGRAVRTRDSNGLWTETFFGFAGEVVQTRSQAINENGQIVWMVSRTAYDELGRAFLTADTALETTSTTLGTRTFYDEMGRSVKVERRSGVVLTLVDRYGAVVRDASKAEGPYSIRIDNQGVDSNGNINLISRSLSTYDAQGKLIKSVSGIGPTGSGHDGVETRYEYDFRGRQVRQIGAPVQTVEAKEPLRLVTETEYDDQGRAYKTWTNIRGRDLGGEVLIDKRFALSTTQVYDNLGRAYKTIAADGSSTEVGYDAWGNATSEKDAAGHVKQMAYDANGRLITVTLPGVADPLDSDGDGKTANDAPRFDYAYDWAGNQTVLRDALGRVTKFKFNDSGQRIERKLPAKTNGNDTVETFEYNNFGQQVKHTSFEGIRTEWEYDNGKTDAFVDDNNASIVRKTTELVSGLHVGSGRLKEQRFYDPLFSLTVAKEVWKYTYDAFGRKTAVERHARATLESSLVQSRLEQWFYDAQGRLVQEAKPEGNINYAYDTTTGQKTRMWTTKAAGLAPANLADAVEDNRYSYNELGWLVGITVVEKNDTPLTNAQQEKTAYGYDLQGRQLRIDLPDGVIQTSEVDELGAITHMRQYAPDKTPYDLGDNPKLADYEYKVVNGQRIRLHETFWYDVDTNPNTPPNPSVAKTTTYDWTYDENNRLVSEVVGILGDNYHRTDSYVMDLFGNRLKRTSDLASTPGVVDDVISYLYDANDRLQSESLDNGNNGSVDKTTAYTWNNTQQASKTVTSGSIVTSQQTFSYDLQGRLSSVASNTGGNSTKVDYKYDSNGIRISATEFAGSVIGNTTEYLIDANNFTGYAQTIVETTKNAAGQVLKRIVYTFGTDEITQTKIDYSTGVLASSSTLHFGHDAHGSVRVLLDAAGAIAQTFTYAAYGEMIAIHNVAGSSVGNAATLNIASQALTSLLYNGESFDSRIGLLYLRARWYDMHRFTTLDPFFGNAHNPLSWNKYGFVHGNPISITDPTGLEGIPSLSVGIGVGIGILGITGAGVGYFSKSDGGFWQSIIPGFGSGRGLGAAIAAGDPLGIVLNGAFLALDILTAGGWSFVFKGVGKPVLNGISKEALEALYQSVVKVANDPKFIERAIKAGFEPDIIKNLIPAIDDYIKNASFGIREGLASWVDDTTFALTKSGAKSWNTIAHELTHILDGISQPGLLKQGGATAFETLKAEYKAFYVSMGNPFMAGTRSFAQYAAATAGDGRYFLQSLRQFMNAFGRWSDGDEDLLDMH